MLYGGLRDDQWLNTEVASSAPDQLADMADEALTYMATCRPDAAAAAGLNPQHDRYQLHTAKWLDGDKYIVGIRPPSYGGKTPPSFVRRLLNYGAPNAMMFPASVHEKVTGLGWAGFQSIGLRMHRPGEESPSLAALSKLRRAPIPDMKHQPSGRAVANKLRRLWRFTITDVQWRSDSEICTRAAEYHIDSGYAYNHVVGGGNDWEPAPGLFNLLAVQSLETDREWTVHLRYDTSQVGAVALSTDALGIREMFALRDIPNGRSRRAALRHWVKGHARKSRSDKSALAWVEAHLRGAEDFSWSGLVGRILPPLSEIIGTKYAPKGAE